MPQQYKPTPESCAEWIKDHQYTQLAKTKDVEVWRAQTPGSHSYAFDLTISRYGMAMYGDTGALVFDVGAGYGLKFLTSTDDHYVFSKLDQCSRAKDLDEAYLLDIVYRAITDLLAERDLELPEWLPATEPMPDRVQQLDDWLMRTEGNDGEYSALVVALRECQNLEFKSVSGAYEWLSDRQELLELADDMDYSLTKPTNAVMQRIYMLRHAAKQILAIKEAEPAPVADSLEERMKAAGMLSVAELLAGTPMDAFTKHAGVNGIATLGQWAEMKRAEYIKLNARYELGEKPKDELYEWVLAHAAVFTELHVNLKAAQAGESPEQLYAVHAEGPDELFAATSLEVAQKHARDLNVLHGGGSSAKVIDTPWTPAEHWKTLAEQNQHMVDDLRAQNGHNVVESARAIARYHVELMAARSYIVGAEGWESDKAAVETVAGIDKLLSSKWPHDGSHETGPVQYAYTLADAHPSDSWTNDSLASFVSDHELAAGAVIQRGEASKNNASYYLPDIDDVINHMANQASDDSEYADGFPDLTKAQEVELDTLMEPMRAWVDKHCDVRFYEVSDIEPYTVTDADVSAAQAYRAQLDTGAQA
jgi:hypothetical protein